MFICHACHGDQRPCIHFVESRGRCEVCGKIAVCVDCRTKTVKVADGRASKVDQDGSEDYGYDVVSGLGPQPMAGHTKITTHSGFVLGCPIARASKPRLTVMGRTSENRNIGAKRAASDFHGRARYTP
jgi:hypothetical protein